MQEPYDLPFPDDRWPQGRPDVAGSSSTSSAAGSQAAQPSLAEALETGRTAPANQNQTWKPNHDPDPEVTSHDPDHHRPPP